MADHVKVVVYVRADDARRLKDRGIRDIPTWVRDRVKEAVLAQPIEKEA
jgi:hypothetical protein